MTERTGDTADAAADRRGKRSILRVQAEQSPDQPAEKKRQDRFSGVAQKRDQTVFFTENARHVGRSRVSAAEISNVVVESKPADQQRKLHISDCVSQNRNQKNDGNIPWMKDHTCSSPFERFRK